MDPATTGYTEAVADRATGKSRGMKQYTYASGGSRHLVYRWPGFSQVWPLQNRAASPWPCPAIPSRTTRSKNCSRVSSHMTGWNRRRNPGALHPTPTSILRCSNAQWGQIPPCSPELGRTGKVAPDPRWDHHPRRWGLLAHPIVDFQLVSIAGLALVSLPEVRWRPTSEQVTMQEIA